MEENVGQDLYELFCVCIKESHPEVKPFKWDQITKDQKKTWNLLQKKLNQRKIN